MIIEQAFAEWLDNINEIEKIDNSIIGFNFGLFETTKGFEMYLIGSKKFEIIFTIPISSKILIIKINGINILYKGIQISLISKRLFLKNLFKFYS
mgnify:CR=1 FL=1